MNCFVIMPFSRDFDDVYASIKSTVERALAGNSGRCHRLDESRPAGRITDRLLVELRAASFCIADLTGSKPNVMWEVGYAMAMAKPTVIITQSLQDLPFDLKDMQTLQYDRNHLAGSLSKPLHQMVVDTLATGGSEAQTPVAARDEVISELRGQVTELKSIVSQAVTFWNPSGDKLLRAKEVTGRHLEGLGGVLN